MIRSHLAIAGFTISLFLILHAAMLAGGAHASHPAKHHRVSAHFSHSVGMELMPAPDRGAHSPALESAEMAECSLLGTAIVRLKLLFDAVPATRSLIQRTVPNAQAVLYAPVVTGVSRAQLQVFLI